MSWLFLQTATSWRVWARQNAGSEPSDTYGFMTPRPQRETELRQQLRPRACLVTDGQWCAAGLGDGSVYGGSCHVYEPQRIVFVYVPIAAAGVSSLWTISGLGHMD